MKIHFLIIQNKKGSEYLPFYYEIISKIINSKSISAALRFFKSKSLEKFINLLLFSKIICTFEGVGQLHTNEIIKSKTKLMKMTIANRCGGSTWQLLLLLNKVEINNRSINPLTHAGV